MGVKEVITLLGGIALFLFGMSLMGDGLKKAAGNKLEIVLNKLSGTSIKGIILGTAVTAVIQSSSATSVMAIGFVNSEMMKLKQAVSVIMGAIIGTSITGWIICLSEVGGSSSAALSLLSTETISAIAAITGILISMISKKKTQKNFANVLLGFSVLMFGMKTMSGAVSGLKSSPEFISFMTSFSNPLLGILAGLLATALLQSASAAVGILQALTAVGTLTFGISLPIVMGIAIGASVPVLIASAGATKDGKRTAYSYLIIEVLRVIIFSIVFYGLNSFIGFGFMEKTMNMVDIALLNTVFRLTTIIVLAPFADLIVKITTIIIKPNPAEEEKTRDINRLQDSFLAYPALAVEQSKNAVLSMAKLTRESLDKAMSILKNYSDKTYDEVEALETLCDKYEDKIGNYLAKLTACELNSKQNAFVNQYLRIINDYERISDHAMNIAERAEEIKEKDIQFTPAGEKELNNMMAIISEVVTLAIESFVEESIDKAYRVEPLEEIVDNLSDLLKSNHIRRLQNGECTIGKGYVFNDLLVDFERISDHCSNIALSVVELNDSKHGIHEIEDLIEEKHSENYEKWFSFYKEKYYNDYI